MADSPINNPECFQVTGENPVKSVQSFEECGLKDFVLSNVKKSGYKTPTPVQKHAIPIVMAGRDLMACAQTGSGKTAAFLVPIINDLLDKPTDLVINDCGVEPQVVILSPTRELALQIGQEARKFAHQSILKVTVVYGGTSVMHQADMLMRGCHILVATPGRLNDFVNRGRISFGSVRYVVLDEADRMLDMGFQPEMEKMFNNPSMPPTVRNYGLLNFLIIEEFYVQKPISWWDKRCHHFWRMLVAAAAASRAADSAVAISRNGHMSLRQEIKVLAPRRNKSPMTYMRKQSTVRIFEHFGHICELFADERNGKFASRRGQSVQHLKEIIRRFIVFPGVNIFGSKSGTIPQKIEALKKTIHMIANGERLPGLLMHIIRFILPLQDHMIKKLLLIFWEIVPKTNPDGKLLQEMILVCDAYRKDLQHPNEFVRGSTLRFLCKLKEPELLEPLMAAIRSCLEHRVSYVRRNAVLAIFTIYKNFEFLIPDAPELIANFLDGEQDMSCKRNAFLMLLHADQERALSYLASCLDQVTSFGDILQLVIVELIYKVCHANPSERSRFIRCIYNLLNSNSPAVRYEAAGTLITLSNAPTAIKAAASCYIDLIIKESDNNVKLIVLDRLIALREIPTYERVLQDLVMDILRVLASPDMEVRKKALNLALDLTTSRCVEEVVLMLRKEVAKTHNLAEHEETGKYRQLLVRTLHSCSMKFPDVAASVIPVLMEFLSDSNELASQDVLIFVREAVHKFENLRNTIIEKLLEAFPSIKFVKVHRAALWILGEYASSLDDVKAVMKQIKQNLGELPIVEDETKRAAGEKTEEPAESTPSSGTGGSAVAKLVTSDGTYASQSVFSTVSSSKKEDRPPLRQYLMDGDYFIGSTIASTLVKLSLKFDKLEADPTLRSQFCNECMLIIACILHLGRSGLSAKPVNNDDAERMLFCLRALWDGSATIEKIFTQNCRDALAAMLTAQYHEEVAQNKAKEKTAHMIQVDDPVSFLQLSTLRNSELGTENVFELSLTQALGGQTGGGSGGSDKFFSASKLNKVTQLTGFSDPVYAEAYVQVNQYDIVLDVLIVNQTADTLQNCTLELATLGDLKLVEKPQPCVLAPHDFCNIKANVKVASTENGIIFGNIVYDVSGAASDRNVVVLNDIHIDIMDYIVPASCSDTEFRQMWAEFEWENKVSVNTNLTDLHEYLAHLLKSTNMKCLTPEKALCGQCGFMAANMYARSIFGEDALANLSIEMPFNKPDAPVTGHIRIRAKSQGMALSLGDKINMTQKRPQKMHGT
ncbi:unnamed protein product [Nesidiocoris tenuis]|uniref:Coatomer subunit beta n=1 Tax=Nesidiocoris tenuis TaxID=355587 RepID=A0A6H5HH21_9HEMI|nr:unnamed protein product [Nesidiocoris tenuis]